MKKRFQIIPAVFLLLIKDNKVLMMRRFNTGHQDGNYSLPAGHLNGNETLREALSREVSEEIGLQISPADFTLVHVQNMRGTDAERINFFFTATSYKGKPYNKEPEKCDKIDWFALANPPETIVFYVKSAIENFQKNLFYSEIPWK